MAEFPIVSLEESPVTNAQVALIVAAESLIRRPGGASGYTSPPAKNEILKRADEFKKWLDDNS
jgi:hypothetical protein